MHRPLREKRTWKFVVLLAVLFSWYFLLNSEHHGGFSNSPEVSHQGTPLVFVSAAYNLPRWGDTDRSRAIQLMYSSLARSQLHIPKLYLFTDDVAVVPNRTTFNTHADIVVINREFSSFPRTPFDNKWIALSRLKLDMVEEIIYQSGKRAVWIDLDTLIFVDLTPSSLASSWFVGYQHGGCNGSWNCSWFPQPIAPINDCHGDLWSLTMEDIRKVRDYEKGMLKRGEKLPKFDLQGYFTMMIQHGELPATFIHHIIPYSFGFACSSFKHNSAHQFNVVVSEESILCPVHVGVDLPPIVGGLSFTADSFKAAFLKERHSRFMTFPNEHFREWLLRWFYDDVASSTGS
jgi:hypothetical protein